MSLSPEQIEANFEKVLTLLSKLGDRSRYATAMVEALGERLALCPASGKKEYHAAFPGGLVDHSLRVLGNAFRMNGAFGWNLPKDSLIISCLFHDLGKVGDVSNDYYIPSTDQWRIEKLGEVYTINKNIPYMTVPARAVFLCQYFGLQLSQVETLAILLSDGQYVAENAPYKLKEPVLALVVHMADIISMRQEKGDLPA